MPLRAISFFSSLKLGGLSTFRFALVRKSGLALGRLGSASLARSPSRSPTFSPVREKPESQAPPRYRFEKYHKASRKYY
jgi:hypothetical protein